MAEEVRPEIIEDELAPLSGADEWLAGIRDRVDKAASRYNPYDIEDATAYAQAKRERAAVRRDISEIDTERKSLTRVIDDAIKRFRADAKDVLRPLTELDEGYKQKIDEYGEMVAQRRRQELEECYREAAPLMAIPSDGGRALVTFDKLLERYGMGQKGKKWLLQSTNLQEAKNELIDALREIQEYEAVIAHSVAPDDVDVAKSVYFDTLDMSEALAEVDRRAQQRKRLEALEQERREIVQWEAEQKPEPEPEPEPEPKVVKRAAPAAQDGIWVFAGYGTKEQADLFTEWCRENGIERNVAIPTNGRNYRLTTR